MDTVPYTRTHIDTDVSNSYASPNHLYSSCLPVSSLDDNEDHPQDMRTIKVHQRSAVLTESPEKFVCSDCSYTSKRRSNLARHRQAMHSLNKQLECCGKTFRSKCGLRRHVRNQHNHGYSCWKCMRVFCRKALLKRHMTVHSGIKEFICGSCTYASSHKSNLERHQRVHEKPAREMEKPTVKTFSKQGHFALLNAPNVNNTTGHLNSLHQKLTRTPPSKQPQNQDKVSSVSLATNRTINSKRLFANPYKCLACKTRWQSQHALRKHERELHPDVEVHALLSLPIIQVLQLVRSRVPRYTQYANSEDNPKVKMTLQ